MAYYERGRKISVAEYLEEISHGKRYMIPYNGKSQFEMMIELNIEKERHKNKH